MEQLIIPRPAKEKAVRHWINHHAGGDCLEWDMEECLAYVAANHPLGVEAFRPADYTALDAYIHASHGARRAVDAVFHAVRNSTGPDLQLGEGPGGSLSCYFTWHDGARYRVQVTASGILTRLFRMELTGEWGWDEVDGRCYPMEAWRTVRVFSKDRAGKVLTPVLGAGFPATSSWLEAAAR